MSDFALCVICADGEPQPIICRRCEDRVARTLAIVTDLRQKISAWPEIDPGSPCKDEPHRLSLIDNPILTASGSPNLTVIAATDIRTRRIPSGGGWDPDDVVAVDAELLTEARLICEERHLSSLPATITECLSIIADSFEWSIRSPRVDEFAAVLESCAFGLRALMRDLPDPPLGRCPQPDPRGEQDACGGPLRWRTDTSAAWSSDGGDLAAIELVCSRCQDVWTSSDLALFGRVSPVNIWDSVPRVAHMLGVPERTLRRWAASGKVHRDGFGRVHHAEVWHILEGKKEAPSRAND